MIRNLLFSGICDDSFALCDSWRLDRGKVVISSDWSGWLTMTHGMLGWAALAAAVEDFSVTVIYDSGRALVSCDDVVVCMSSNDVYDHFYQLCGGLGGNKTYYVAVVDDAIFDDCVLIMDGMDGKLHVRSSRPLTIWSSWPLRAYRLSDFVVEWPDRSRGPVLSDLDHECQ
ncbi:MAG: hypothetical protein WC284_09215 [Candidimonas sp.]